MTRHSSEGETFTSLAAAAIRIAGAPNRSRQDHAFFREDGNLAGVAITTRTNLSAVATGLVGAGLLDSRDPRVMAAGDVDPDREDIRAMVRSGRPDGKMIRALAELRPGAVPRGVAIQATALRNGLVQEDVSLEAMARGLDTLAQAADQSGGDTIAAGLAEMSVACAQAAVVRARERDQEIAPPSPRTEEART